MYGDANCDGEVEALDASAILRHIVKLAELTERGKLLGDVDGDGVISAADAASVLRWVVRIIDKFPVELAG
ncbi:MAG: dockerin type I repeat-containing protein [Clostridia bacterium]|nr:dockerin type I repeat-containing protein [Clostridia bacterium]